MIVLAVELAAIRIDANLRFRELQRTAFPTFSADESGEHFLVAIEGGQRGLPVDFTAESVFQSHEVVESEILVVVRLFNAPCEEPRYTHLRPTSFDIVGHLKHNGIAALTKTGDDNDVTGLCRLKDFGQHNQCMGST